MYASIQKIQQSTKSRNRIQLHSAVEQQLNNLLKTTREDIIKETYYNLLFYNAMHLLNNCLAVINMPLLSLVSLAE